MGEIEFVVQDGCEKERCGFGTEDERSKRGGAKACRPGSTNFGGGEIAFGANK
jgi:hypothetical protein